MFTWIDWHPYLNLNNDKKKRKLFDFCSSSSSKRHPAVCGSSSDYPSGSNSMPGTELSEESKPDLDELPE